MKRKTFHNYEIIDILNALFSSDSLVNSKDPDKKLSVRILWKINGNINTLKAIQMRISEEEQKINEEYFNDEKSQKNENGLQEVKPEFRTEFLNKKQELMNIENEVELSMIKLSELADVKFVPSDFMSIAFMIEEDGEVQPEA